MRQSLVKKYHQDDPTSSSLTDTPDAATSTWDGHIWPWIAPLVASFSWGSGSTVQAVRQHFLILKGDEVALRRSTAHLIVLFIIALAIGLNRAPFAWNGIRAIQPLRPAPSNLAVPTVDLEGGAPLTLPAQLNDADDDVLVRGAVPRTIIPDRTKEEITTYSVQSGDTIFGIAARFGLAPETLMWSNPALENNPDLLSVGQELTILPVDGVYHQVGGGDTIESIAATYRADPTAIIDYPLNALDPENIVIEPGQWLIVPGGSKPFIPQTVTAYSGPIPADATVGSGIFGWPTSGSISQGYWSAHRGIDIAAWIGASITAADSGHVVAAGWDDTGYGNMVVMDHGNGFQTLYAHLQTYYVEAGDNVAKGQQIGEMGSTGNSTGPHVHFEVRQGTVQRNPIGFLP
jgi:murein DD-endopeptidase MepM/ murein hydrolase activator NlpD